MRGTQGGARFAASYIAIILVTALAFMGVGYLVFAPRDATDASDSPVREKPVESITLSTDALSLSLGDTAAISSYVEPSGAGIVVWSSSNESAVMVNQGGMVTAVGEGVAYVSATIDTVSAYCRIEVLGTSPEPPEPDQETDIAASFPREWSGSLGGIDDIHLSFSSVGDDGHVLATFSVRTSPNSANVGGGSYNVEGDIDWESKDINLWWVSWFHQGTLETKRHFRGTFNSSFTSITGSCETLGGHDKRSWSVQAD